MKAEMGKLRAKFEKVEMMKDRKEQLYVTSRKNNIVNTEKKIKKSAEDLIKQLLTVLRRR